MLYMYGVHACVFVFVWALCLCVCVLHVNGGYKLFGVFLDLAPLYLVILGLLKSPELADLANSVDLLSIIRTSLAEASPQSWSQVF